MTINRDPNNYKKPYFGGGGSEIVRSELGTKRRRRHPNSQGTNGTNEAACLLEHDDAADEGDPEPGAPCRGEREEERRRRQEPRRPPHRAALGARDGRGGRSWRASVQEDWREWRENGGGALSLEWKRRLGREAPLTF